MEVDLKVVFAKTSQDRADAIVRNSPKYGPPKSEFTFNSKGQHMSIQNGKNNSCTAPILGAGFCLVFQKN